MKKRVVVLGSSGSIGKNTVRVLEKLSDRFETVGLAVKSSVENVVEQAGKLGCKHVAVADASAYDKLKSLAPAGCQCSCGEAALVEMASRSDVDIVVCAIVGTGGLLPVLAALQANKRVALASKEVNKRGYTFVQTVLEDTCIGCASCAIVCPDGCISVYKVKQQ